MQVSKTCTTCGGTGKIVKEPCERCRGKGKVRKQTKISVTIPAGIDDRSNGSIKK
jgi:molecular chaperone DnaJ